MSSANGKKLPIAHRTERLLLRRYRPSSDSAVYWRMLGENQAHLREFLPDNLAGAQGEADIRKVMGWMARQWRRGELFVWGLWERSSGAYVGEVYLANADWSVPCIEVGYFTVGEQGGKGYAAEAARAACGLAFDQLGVRRVELQCAGDNEKSARVAERCGFRLEARLRERWHKKDGIVADKLWFGLLRGEWEKKLTAKYAEDAKEEQGRKRSSGQRAR